MEFQVLLLRPLWRIRRNTAPHWFFFFLFLYWMLRRRQVAREHKGLASPGKRETGLPSSSADLLRECYKTKK